MFLKKRVPMLAILLSLVFHWAGFILFKVEAFSVESSAQNIQIGLIESRWMEPFVDLPGEPKMADRKIFESQNMDDPILNLPQDNALFLQDSNLVINEKRNLALKHIPKKKSLSLVINSTEFLSKKTVSKANIQGPVSERTIVYQKNPDYPAWALQYGLEFEIKLRFWVKSTGDISFVVVDDSSGYPEIDADIVRAMKRWRFNEVDTPSMQWGTIVFKFRLQQ